MKVSHIQSLNLKRYHCLHNMRLEISSLKIFSFQTGNDLDYLQFTVIRSEGKPRKNNRTGSLQMEQRSRWQDCLGLRGFLFCGSLSFLVLTSSMLKILTIFTFKII